MTDALPHCQTSCTSSSSRVHDHISIPVSCSEDCDYHHNMMIHHHDCLYESSTNIVSEVVRVIHNNNIFDCARPGTISRSLIVLQTSRRPDFSHLLTFISFFQPDPLVEKRNRTTQGSSTY